MKEFPLPNGQGKLRYQDMPACTEREAEKEPLICLHGIGCAGSFDMVNVAAQGSLRGRRRILVDLLGAGYSDVPEDFGYAVEDHAACVVALTEALELKRFALFGHSLGGAVALAMAARCQKGALAGIVLGEGNLDPGGGTFTRRIARWSLEGWLAEGFDQMLAAERGRGNGLWAASLAKWDGRGLWRVAQSAMAGGKPDWRQTLYELDCPKCYVFGERTLPHEDAEELPKRGVAIRILPKTGHSMTWENPTGLARAIEEAIAD